MICLLCAAILLLAAGCTAGDPQSTAPETQPSQTAAEEQPQQFSDDPAIAATWVNGGTTPDGRDYVETMILLSDGSAMITINYDEGSFQTLTGTYTVLNGTLRVSIDADEPYDRVYGYKLDANVLTLNGDGKSIVYRRSD